MKEEQEDPCHSDTDHSCSSRRILENEEEMKKLNNASTVPPEVKEWLLSTFYNEDGSVRRGKLNGLMIGGVHRISKNWVGRLVLNFQ